MVDWLCFPRFDAPSVFGRLLDESAGYWSVSVANATAIRRRYLDGTLVLETELEPPTGRLTLTDALAVGPNERGHELGARSPHALLRRTECTAGTIELAMEYEPRPEYGLMRPALREVSGGLLATGDGSVLLLSSAVPLGLADGGAFLLCTFWLAHALALGGEVDRAREVFERAAAWANDVGLLAEEVDGATRELLGNFPQAFSHVGSVNAAWTIAQAEAGRAAPATVALR